MMFDDNPYRSPTSDALEPAPLEVKPGGDILATLVHRSWVYRRFQLSGRVTAMIEYNGRGWSEFVRVNGVVVFKERNWGYALIPRMDFHLCNAAATVPATLEVRGVVRLTAFRLLVDGALIYSEGRW